MWHRAWESPGTAEATLGILKIGASPFAGAPEPTGSQADTQQAGGVDLAAAAMGL